MNNCRGCGKHSLCLCIQATAWSFTGQAGRDAKSPRTTEVIQISSPWLPAAMLCATNLHCRKSLQALGQPDPNANPGLQQLIIHHQQSFSSLHWNTSKKSSHLLKEEKSKHPLARASPEYHGSWSLSTGFERTTSVKGSLPTKSSWFCSVLRLNARYSKWTPKLFSYPLGNHQR